MSRRILMLAAVAALAPSAAFAAAGSSSWAKPEIDAVVASGLMGPSTGTAFRPNDPLTRQELANLTTDLKARLQPVDPPPDATTTTTASPTTATTTTPTTTATASVTTTSASVAASPAVTDPAAPVTMAQLDAQLVRTLGLGRAAAEFAAGARAAGLQIPSRFGTEATARLLGLRTNHPAAQDALELLPGDPATRAETAYSVARILDFQDGETDSVRSAADSFSLPQLTPWQQRILDTAVSFIGYPYVWGGTSAKTETLFGVTSRGGFDCSGFVWRVYKLQAYPDEGDLASVLRGRATYQMSGEVPKAERIGFADLQPGDVLFWGAKGARSKPAQIDHAGIYLGNGWFIHSSDYGVAIAQLTGWYRTRFAWARRPLAEAHLQ